MTVSPQDVLARRDQVLARLAALPQSADRTRERLERLTRLFIETEHFSDAVRQGWTDRELFGCAPDAAAIRVDRQGIVTSLALSSLAGPKLRRLEPHRAVIECASGGVLVSQRCAPGGAIGEPWFEQPAFTGGADV